MKSTGAAVTIYGAASAAATYYPINERVNTAPVQHQPLTIATTTSGNWRVGGLPYTPISGWEGGLAIGNWKGFGGASAGYPLASVNSGDPSVRLLLNTTVGGTPSSIAVTTGVFAAFVQMSGVYQVA